ncbi:methyl-accepting chemotaxis protein [Mangrovibacter yixingensis]|uniref:methyl-accepting chemotaxis protein n=1 Tax=Mangrovibacter yixingensis TaxID=1529639 RepID=UPI001CFAEAB3|nr:methyl-accepting chemotaxis protein [Mangrovibacter yixingensis]
MRFIPARLSGKLLSGGVIILAVTVLIVYFTMQWFARPRIIDASNQLILQAGNNLSANIDQQLKKIEGQAISMARLAEQLPHQDALYKDVLPGMIDAQQNNTIAGGGIWPEPNAFSEGEARHSFFWARGNDGKLTFSNGYNDPSTADYHNESWYTAVKNAPGNQCTWSEVYQDPVSGVNMVTCSVPYHNAAGQFAGVATIDVQLDNLGAYLQKSGTVTGGYTFVLDATKQIIFSPVAHEKQLMSLAQLAEKHPWLTPVNNAVNQFHDDTSVTAVGNLKDPLLGEHTQVSLFHMKSTGWVIGLVTPDARVSGLAATITHGILFILVPVLAVLMLGFWVISKTMTRRLNATQQALHEIAHGDGDLTRRLDDNGEDELAGIAHAFNQFADKIASVVRSAQSTSEIVAEGAAALADNNSGLADKIAGQAAALEQSAAAMEQLNATVRQNADNVRVADQLAEKTAGTAQQNDQVMKQVISSMNNIRQASGRVGEILRVIDDITFQTNILALNASVEAARAGEQGRGFAVVAGEVRLLAQRSATASHEIKALIDDSNNHVLAGSQFIDNAGKQLAQLVNDVEQVKNIMAEIRVAGDEQSKGIDEVTRAVSQMEQTVAENLATINQTAHNTTLLRQEAQELASEIAVFRVSEQELETPEVQMRPVQVSALPAPV